MGLSGAAVKSGCSGVHRLFEGQGRKYSTFLPLKRAL